MVTKGNVIKKKGMIQALKTNLGVVTDACRQMDIARKTHYQWLKEDPEYKEQVEEIPEITLDFVEGALLSLVRDKNPTAIIFYLKTQGKKRGYVEKTEIENTHKGEGVQIIIHEKNEK